MTYLFQFLLYNRAGTRTGRATWLYFGVVIAGIIMGRLLDSEAFAMGVVLLSPLVLLLNRLDRSGPTRDEFEAQLAECADYLKQEATWSYRLGRCVGRKPVVRKAITSVPWILLSRLLLLALVILVVYFAYFKTPKTNGMYLQELIDSHTMGKTASRLIAQLKTAPETANYTETDWKDMEEGLSKCLIARAADYATSADPYLRRPANKDTSIILANRFLKACGATE